MVPRVSIIIAVGEPGEYILECIGHCLELDYPDFEIIVLPDEAWEPPDPRIRVIPTGKIRPAEKRDRGVQESTGDIVAIIDDDAYPERDWLMQAFRHFSDPDVAAVGGPGLTPPTDSLRQRISGWIYESPMVSSSYTYRYKPGVLRDVDDYPTSSLLIRKSDFVQAGGFDTDYWPGEDTILCLKLTHELGKRIVYDSEVRVYHHRRKIFSGHLRQIKSYALHRGFFARKFPQTSLRISYFVPSLFALFSLLGWMSIWAGEGLFIVWAAVMCMYGVLVLVFSLKSFNLLAVAGVFTGTFITHIVYGLWFVKGLLSSELRD
ncbi:glycosyltransferase [Candidatus Latescibacterota bacterium]